MAESTFKRYRLNVSGIVQGVGFRPFVYRLATDLGLSGFVFNDGEGVVVEIEGAEISLERFKEHLLLDAPPLSQIDTLTSKTIPTEDTTTFVIQTSKESSVQTMVSPDMAICEACRAEMNDIHDRRYHYPFINCTHCGPRYSIIAALPYDRPKTSMAPFKMCKACSQEYNDPSDRRYHAQPISCYDCGPKLSVIDLHGATVAEDVEAINYICMLILRGKTVAIKGLGGFHLVCDATNEAAVAQLRRDKRRVTKPLAVMFDTLENAEKVACLGDGEQMLLSSKEHPIVIVRKNSTDLLAPSVAPGINKVGLFLAYTPLHLLILEKLKRPIVATSANLSDQPIITDEDEVLNKLGSVVHAVLSYDRKIINACDDSVVTMAGSEKVMLRMARGYAPKSLLMPHKSNKKVLALGANQKNTIALGFGDHMILSPHIGDLVSLDALEYFERTLETFKTFYGFEPDVVVCDKHPRYESSIWAKKFTQQRVSIELIELQHHYAHALACMAEYQLDEPVLAFCFDGTGYGEANSEDDATLWGGEVLIVDTQKYKRIKHLRPFKLIGGEKAVKEPRRVALSLLFACYDLDRIIKMDNPTVKSFDTTELKTLHTMYQRDLNAPLSSSVGRLFDAVASLMGIAQTLGYEGESGLLIESEAEADEDAFYNYKTEGDLIDWEPMLQEILLEEDHKSIAAKFMNTLCNIILDIALEHPELPVVLSGGVFQNQYLVNQLSEAFKKEQVRYYVQTDTPVNDGGIALGQLYYALKKEER